MARKDYLRSLFNTMDLIFDKIEKADDMESIKQDCIDWLTFADMSILALKMVAMQPNKEARQNAILAVKSAFDKIVEDPDKTPEDLLEETSITIKPPNRDDIN